MLAVPWAGLCYTISNVNRFVGQRAQQHGYIHMYVRSNVCELYLPPWSRAALASPQIDHAVIGLWLFTYVLQIIKSSSTTSVLLELIYPISRLRHVYHERFPQSRRHGTPRHQSSFDIRSSSPPIISSHNSNSFEDVHEVLSRER